MDVCMKRWILLSLLFSLPTWASFTVSTYNIRNFDQDSSRPTDHGALGDVLTEMKSDVMAFEEVVNAEAFKGLVKTYLPGYSTRISSCGGFGKQKLAIAYNPKAFRFVEESEDFDFSGTSGGCGSLRPLFLVTLQRIASKETIVFGVVHLKAGGQAQAMRQRWEQYKKLVAVANNVEEENLILLGDFNTTGYAPKDNDFKRFTSFLKGTQMQSMSEDLGCTSYWHGGGRQGSLYQPSVLDHVVLTQNLVSEVTEVKLGAHCAEQECNPATPEDLGVTFESVSDHCPIQVTFK